MPSKFLNISTDTTLGGSSASDSTVSSQKAIKAYVDGKQTLSGLTDVTISNPTAGQNLTYDATNQVWKNTSTSATVAWGGITGTMSDQTDLKNALDAKYDASNPNGYTSNVGTVTSVNNVSPVNGNVTISIPSEVTESTVSGWGFTKNAGTVTSVNNVSPVNGNVSITIPTVDQSYSGTSANAQSGVAIAGAGFLTSITGSMVTTALGYTPYNSSNPSGYQANVIETIKVNGTALTPSSKAVDITVPAAQVNSDWNASSGVAQILNKPSLATVATSGSYNDLTGTPTIPTVNNATLTITQGGTTKGTFTANASSNVTINLDSGGGSVDVDNKSITTNSSDEIQTVGVINSRDSSTAIKTWTGTKAQYDAIVTKDANTLYNITDDTDVTLTILEALYPVGSVYITTANTCPLSALISGSTWSLVSSGRVLQGADSGHSAGTTIEAGLPNITGVSCWAATSAYSPSGAFYPTSTSKYSLSSGIAETVTAEGFNASRANSIYGNSNTVQPPAYCVNIYRRTA